MTRSHLSYSIYTEDCRSGFNSVGGEFLFDSAVTRPAELAMDFERSSGISMTASCPSSAAARKGRVREGEEGGKRGREKKIKGGAEEGESKITYQNSRGSSADISMGNLKATEVQKSDYIHVRARRGQATDSHSLAERVRREKISERMKYLQELVPGCNKLSGKAVMLDEIINYVQSLQRQVEFLSMKLASIDPMLYFNIDDFFMKEAFPACSTSYPAAGVPEMAANPSCLQFDQVQQFIPSCRFEMGTNPLEMKLNKTSSAPGSILPEDLLGSSCFTQVQPCSIWDAEIQSFLGMEF